MTAGLVLGVVLVVAVVYSSNNEPTCGSKTRLLVHWRDKSEGTRGAPITTTKKLSVFLLLR